MTHLKDLLGDLRMPAGLGDPALPMQLELTRARITQLLGNVIPLEPSRFDLLETFDAVSATPFTPEAMLDLPSRHLKRTPWVMFESVREGTEALAENRRFLSAFLSALERRLFGPAIVNLAMVFLRFYPEGKAYFDFLRRGVARLVAQLDTPQGRILKTRGENYGLFSNEGPDVLAELLLASRNPLAVLTDAGFDEHSLHRGFVPAAVARAMPEMSRRLATHLLDAPALEVLLEFFTAAPDDVDSLRFPELRGELGNSLLLPFQSTAPAPEMQTLIRRFLLDKYSDPRLNRGNWHGVSEEARTVIMRWLVHTTLEDFFRVVRDGSRQDNDANRMWPYREAFWRAYLNKGVITDAWVVLGYAIAKNASAFLEGQRNSYGKLDSGQGIKPFHAVLILRIGDLVITEWNHMGKYRLWHADNEHAPKFYCSTGAYSRADLTTSPDFDGSHMGANNGRWQGQLAAWIQEWTGVPLSYREYMPR